MSTRLFVSERKQIDFNKNKISYAVRKTAEITFTFDEFVTEYVDDKGIEHGLNVKGMMKNKHLSKAVASQKFYEFRTLDR